MLANSEDPDQTPPRSALFAMPSKRDARLIWVKTSVQSDTNNSQNKFLGVFKQKIQRNLIILPHVSADVRLKVSSKYRSCPIDISIVHIYINI